MGAHVESIKQLLPLLPGVYLFKRDNEIIYVGKAKSIRKRVATYFHKQTSDWKIQALIAEHTHIDYIVTHSEPEALLLEAQLISEHKPKFNVLLKSGQPFVYFLFTHEPLPQLIIVRNKKQKGTYFGPFLQKQQARSAHRYLMSTFKLKSCNKKIPNGCLDFHLGNCSGTCMDNYDTEGYRFRIQLAMNVLQGDYKKTVKSLQSALWEHVKKLEFEKARHINEYLQNLETIFATLKARFSEHKYAKDIFRTTTALSQATHSFADIGHMLQETFKLPHPPITIDCFDVSHFQSSYIVGSCIRFKNGIPDKNNFRRFKIKTLSNQNDYAALQEIVTRRYKDPTALPDLVLIDGGKGQLSAILQVLPGVECIALAKREERVFSSRLPEGIMLDIKTDIGKLLISMRDYAHHFAITYHRTLRSKDMKGIS